MELPKHRPLSNFKNIRNNMFNNTLPYLTSNSYSFTDLSYCRNLFLYYNQQPCFEHHFFFNCEAPVLRNLLLEEGFSFISKISSSKFERKDFLDFEGNITFSNDKKDILITTMWDSFEEKRFICDIYLLYVQEQENYAKELITKIKGIEKFNKSTQNSIHIICSSNGQLELSQHKINFNKVDINASYNDDFKSVDSLISSSLINKTKGIILLHGEPGCGKTSYIRHLTTKVEKRKIIFLPPNMSNELASPSFINLLIENKNSILIIEDSENAVKSRKNGQSQAISNLLNISDGLLSDILNITIIATFNCELGSIDEALTRKGRLICRYEFKKLAKEKAQKLSDSLGYNNKIDRDMSLANIYNQDSESYVEERKSIGF